MSVARVLPLPDDETRSVLRSDARSIVIAAIVSIIALIVRHGWTLVLPAQIVFVVAAAALATVDARLRRLPDALTVPAYPALLLLLALPGAGGPWLRAFLAGLALAGGYYLLALFGGAGLGDVKAAALVGLVVGYEGWFRLLAATVYASLLAGVWALALLAAHRVGRRSQIAFGPFLMSGALLALLM